MPKRRREFEPEVMEASRAAIERQISDALGACSSSVGGQLQSPVPKKKPKAALNFSIESIMQSAAAEPSGQQPGRAGNLFASHYAPFIGRLSPAHSPPPLSSGSSQGSRGSSPARSVASGREHGAEVREVGASRLCRSPPTSISGASSVGSAPSWAANSRASTPISPGGNPNGLADAEPTVDDELETGAREQQGPNLQRQPADGAGGKAGKKSCFWSSSSSSSTWSKERPGCHQQRAGLPANLKQVPGTSQSAANPGDSRLSQVECQLDNKDMWDKFHSLNTEMIITKTGRRMFPVMKVQFHNLDPNARYAVSMDIVPVDNKRYRYAYHKSCWQVAGKADPSAEPRLYPHPDSPFNGDLLSRQVISFEKVKLTNNEMDKSGHIILNSMHKYQPRVHLIELKVPPTQQTTSKLSISSSDHHHHHHHQHQNQHQNVHNQQPHQQQQHQQPQLDIEGYRTFVFPETVFTAVTAYQNQLITKMKIDKNPFAKGFRDSSRLSDLDRNDPFDYMSSLGSSGRFVGQPGAPGSMEAAAAAGAHMEAYQLLASAANNPWYSAAAVAAAAGGGGNPFNPMGACSTAQAAQLQATQMWLAAFSGLLNGGTTGGPGGPTPIGPLISANMLPMPGQSPLMPTNDQTLGVNSIAGGGHGVESGTESGGGSSSANSSGTNSST